MPLDNRTLFDYVPQFYRELRESDAILTVSEEAVRRQYADVADLLDQLFVDTATWGLAHWERVTALEHNASLPMAERRSAIKAKLRGAGTVTLAAVQSLVDSWHGASTQVSEDGNIIAIQFAPREGMSADLRGLRRSLRETLPAHLAWEITVVLRAEDIVLANRAYEFFVPYPICNMFTTAAMPGVFARTNFDLPTRSYGFDVQYPICNTFHPTGQTMMHREKVRFRNKAEVAGYATYNRAGEHNTGEVTL